MIDVNEIMLLGGLLVTAGVLSTKISSRVGVPGLVLFLGVGMLAGSEGIGRIDFENYELAYAVGTVALAIILFDGGLRTSYESVRRAWQPSIVLATVGVVVTAAITGIASARLLGLPLLTGLLLGSIISSTDAAAVFFTLRKQGIRLEDRLAATLEVESGSNDPMAVFLTVATSELILGRIEPGSQLAIFFASQIGVGLLVGLAVGLLGARLINAVHLDAAGLYPVLAAAIGGIAFGLAAVFGGSGFLAIYVAGIIIGNQPLVYREGIFHFHDGAAWIAQIMMFVILGLLTLPSSLIGVAGPGLLVALVLIFVARPLMVAVTAAPFGFTLRELALLSWVGLKGAVPIILANFPLTLGLPEGQTIFNLVFFVVFVSALTQGWSLPLVARLLGLQLPAEPDPPITLELTALRHVDAEILVFRIDPRNRTCGKRIAELPLPLGAVIALVVRDNQVVQHGGGFRVKGGDHVFVVCPRDVRSAVELIFGTRSDDVYRAHLPPYRDILLRGTTTVDELRDYFGVHLDVAGSTTLAELLRTRLAEPALNEFIECDGAMLVVREAEGTRIHQVGLRRTIATGSRRSNADG